MEMKKVEGKDLYKPGIYQADGSFKNITVGVFYDKVSGGGKAMRVTDEEFEEAKKKFFEE